MTGTLRPGQQAIGLTSLAVVQRAVGGGHQRRLDGGRRPAGVGLLEQQCQAGHVRAGHRSALVRSPGTRWHQGAIGNGIALGVAQHGRHSSDHIHARGGQVGLEHVGVTLVGAARRKTGHHWRVCRGAGVEGADGGRGSRTIVDGIGLDGRTVCSADVNGRHRVGFSHQTPAVVGQHHAHTACQLNGQALVDTRVGTAGADHNLAGHLGGIQFKRVAETQVQVGRGTRDAGIFSPDQGC